MAVTTSACGTTRSADHAPSASSGMNSMKRTTTPRSPTERGEVHDLVLVDASHEHDVDLHRFEAGVDGCLDAVEHPVQRRPSGELLEPVSATSRATR